MLFKVPELFVAVNYFVIIISFFSKYNGFDKLSHEVALILFFCSLSFQLLLNLAEAYTQTIKSAYFTMPRFNHISIFDRAIAIALLCYFSYKILTILSLENIWIIFTEIGYEVYNNAYIVYFTIFFSSYYLCNSSKTTDFFLASLLLFNLFLSGIKGIVLIPFISYLIFFSITRESGIPVKSLLAFSFLVIGIFFLIYLLPFYFVEEITLYSAIERIIDKLNFYFVSGVLGLNNDLLNGAPLKNSLDSLLLPLYNFFADSAEKSTYMVNTLTAIQIESNGGSNVKTFWGTIYLHSGELYILVITFFYLINTLFYLLLLLYLPILRYTSISLIIFISVMFYSWFEYYYWHSFIYYGLIYSMLLDMLYWPFHRGFHDRLHS